MISTYILKDKKPIPCPDMKLWLQWIKENTDQVEVVSTPFDTHTLSTFFKGVLTSLDKNAPKLLFITALSENTDDPEKFSVRIIEEYETWEDAEAGHQRAIEWLKNQLEDENA